MPNGLAYQGPGLDEATLAYQQAMANARAAELALAQSRAQQAMANSAAAAASPSPVPPAQGAPMGGGNPPGMLPYGLQKIGTFLKNVVSSWMPNGVMFPRARGAMIEDPQAVYPNALLPCIDALFMFKYTNDAVAGTLTLTPADVDAIKLFNAGTGDSGSGQGVWWNLGLGDTTLQKNGSFVFQGHTFWAWGHTFSYEGVGYRGGDGVSADNPFVSDRNLQDGAGSYAEQILEKTATSVGFFIFAQGDECPRFLGNIVYNGDVSQFRGGALVAMSDANLPFKMWERPYRIGARDDFNKIQGSFAMSVAQVVNHIGGNPPTGNVYIKFRIRVCGGRECGSVVPGCNP